MILKGKVWKFGDNISTDHIIPGRFYHLRSNLEELKKHVFEDISPGFCKKVKKGDIIVGGKNFGLGSSREHAPLIIKMAGIDAIIATSFARIFYRNAINVGLAAIICNTDGINEGDSLEIRVDDGMLVNKTTGDEKSFSPLSSIMRTILNEGGLDHYIARYGGFKI
ncbi:MAG TPA: 3-isopropylmalate dehydratase small subunit [Syntrophorhabdus sp.]|jgi:3-isopropylmalate/(R)-2-methylmalate dehydratase small subunit|nr:3-isopropylmalate dehydratase small subunit [Syntrophorhabdus sp.]OPX94392.1 MAG: 2,3-dimethylmalate dehydratase small subunit [Syntrophorhabdus sp. PtaB.Bin027]OQB78037.1 MAG: 2,3-dimethylmalate dehydratase small subunit [Deltaproteobacteria bacterium ADurb.Bin135]HNQ46864.1 3-isopropylmalate dehydratase small subunit [Syntrophorhabdus sp.]HNS77344.1 3-isopropylmalate dehydratase small subunit [Syntrophorhabdus sp.]